MTENKKPLIIFDTDMDTDCDDAGALLMLINAHVQGDIDLLGVVADSLCSYAAPFCKAVLDYYSLDLPAGEIYGYLENKKRFEGYRHHQELCAPVAYNKMLSKRCDGIYNSTDLYRELLEKAEDKSVTVLCVGMLTAVYEAMVAEPKLFEQKVCRVVLMGNPYKKNDFNFSMDAESTKGFFALCPCPVYISYTGSDVITGKYLKDTLPENHPVRQAYEIWCKDAGRSSWDLIAALFAITPTSSLFKVQDTGRISYNECELVSIIEKDAHPHTVVTLSCTSEEMERILNGLLK